MSDSTASLEQFRRFLADPLGFPLEFKTWLVGYLQENTILGTASRSISNAAVPTGTILEFGGSTAPTGYVMADGTVVSRSTYAALFGVYGTKYNTGGEAGTDFRLPDKRGRVGVGFATSGGHADVSTLGNNDGTALASRRPKHRTTNSLTAPTHSLTLPAHTHTTSIVYVNGGTNLGTPGGSDQPLGTTATYSHVSGNPNSAPAIDGGVTAPGGSVGSNDGAMAFDTPAYIVVNFIIKT